MAALTGNSIDSSYQGLLKTTDNGVISATAKAVTDGLGNATNIEISNTATNFVSGTVDFTGSTVSGLPGGAAGLENGTGSDSLQSAASLTTNAANASATGSIALGDGAEATANKGVAIGDSSSCSSGEGVAIGQNSNAQASGSIAIGASASSTGNNTFSLLYDAQASGDSALAIGLQTRASAQNAVALGTGVTAATANTVSVKSLETQADGGVNIKGDGTNAGKLKLFCEDAGGAHNVTLEGPAHAGGATYTLKFPNVQSAGTQILEADSSGNLSWIDTPSGGGGGAEAAYGMYGGSGMKGVLQYNGSTGGADYKTTIATTGYSTTGLNNGADWAAYTIAGIQPGDTVKEIQFGTSTNNVAGDEVYVAAYDLGINSDGYLYLNDRVIDFGAVDVSSYGDYTLTLATPYTMPSGKLNSQLAFVFFPNATSIGVTHWSNAVWNGGGCDPASLVAYRAMSLFVQPGVSMGNALPASIGDKAGSVNYGAQTNSHVYMLYR